MITEKNAPRLLGAAYLFVLIASVVAGSTISMATGSGNISDMLTSIAANVGTMRISILAELTTSAGIVALASLLFIVLRSQNLILALLALGWWVAEAITLAVGKLGSLALIPLSQEYVAAGAPASSHFQSLGEFLYTALDRQGNEIHMWFFCLGGLIWYSLFFTSRAIPRLLAAWGIASIMVAFTGIIMSMLGFSVHILFYAHIAVFELTIGLWLLLRGVNRTAPA